MSSPGATSGRITPLSSRPFSSRAASPLPQFRRSFPFALGIEPGGPAKQPFKFLRAAGWAGATAAAAGIFLPVYLVVVVLAPSYKRWSKNPQLSAFVRGVTAAATGAIAGSVVVLARRSIYDMPTAIIAVASLAILFRWKVPEPAIIAVAAVIGLVLHHA